jgi:hypothetical protein
VMATVVYSNWANMLISDRGGALHNIYMHKLVIGKRLYDNCIMLMMVRPSPGCMIAHACPTRKPAHIVEARTVLPIRIRF